MSAEKSKYIVSARKYRPTAWDEVVGQEAITSTLANAIEQEQLAHAYLFCGPRGVGKTTCARIFAKEINRDEHHDEDEDFSFNIFELDAASNNKVEDIRNLIDQVRIPPQAGRYKVYIIDEVHMLSAQAFNAFLKTLEEPPPHAIFILATTEKHKIIPTILSRCQIYDFNRIGVDEIATHLRSIAEKEKIGFEDEALHVIGQKADGALRDALSIFDQLSSFTHRNLTYDAVVQNLHVLDYDYHFRMVDHLHSENYQEALLLLDDILRLGFDGSHFVAGLASHLRDLLVAKDERTVKLLEVGETVKKQYFDQAGRVETQWIVEALKETNQTEVQYRNSGNQRLLLEIMLLGMATLHQEKKNSDSNDLKQAKPAPPSKPPAAQTPSVDKPAAPPATAPSGERAAPETPDQAPPTLPPTSPEAPVPPPQRTRRSSPGKTTSINLDDEGGKRPTPKAEVNEPETEYGADPSPAEEGSARSIEDAWKELCRTSLEAGKSALYAILVRQNPAAQMTGKSMEIKLLHEVEMEEFDHHKTELLAALRSLVNDPELAFVHSISEQHADKKLFGSKEKFEYLAEKNPLLHKLKSKLDLDIN